MLWWSLPTVSLERRLCLAFLLACVLFLWTRFVVAPARPGRPRLVRILPTVPIAFVLAFLFDAHRPDEVVLATTCIFTFLWLMPAKLLSFCMNRGLLVRSYDSRSDVAFAICLLLPVNLAFAERPRTENDAAYADVRFEVVHYRGKARFRELCRVGLNILSGAALAVALCWIYAWTDATGRFFWRDVCVSWIVFVESAFVQDLAGAAFLLLAGLRLSDSFDRPYLSQSVGEMWSRRYNLVFAQTLRSLVYEPLRDGRLMHSGKYYAKSVAPEWRRAVALISTFFLSAVLHVGIIWMMFPDPFPFCNAAFFLVNGAIIVAERRTKIWTERTAVGAKLRSKIPSWVCVAYTHLTLMYLSHSLLWVELNQSGLIDTMVRGVWLSPVK